MGNIMLNGATITARAHASPGQQHMAQVVILDGAAIPTPEHFKIWAATLAGHGFTRMRTGALAPRQAAQAERAGLTCVQELSLLDMATPASAPRPMHRTSRLQPSRFDTIAAIDLAAFGANWTLDAAMLADVRSATPSHRARVVALHGAIVGFLISGRANRTGYIQRLAVLPDRLRRRRTVPPSQPHGGS